MFEVSAASRAGSAAPNEDRFLVGESWALVLDGITRYPEDGCVHDVPWYVDRLGAAIADRVADVRLDLGTVLALAIGAVNGRHSGTCDLENPVSPGATVGIVRLVERRVEWLVLGDCTLAERDLDDTVRAETDGRLQQLADPPGAVDVGGVRRFPVDYIARVRNREGGFWVASTDPDAAGRAFRGTWPLDRIGELLLCTDGLTRLTERYDRTLHEMFAMASGEGMEALIDLVREEAERDGNIHPKAKRHDDATGVLLRCNPSAK